MKSFERKQVEEHEILFEPTKLLDEPFENILKKLSPSESTLFPSMFPSSGFPSSVTRLIS